MGFPIVHVVYVILYQSLFANNIVLLDNLD